MAEKVSLSLLPPAVLIKDEMASCTLTLSMAAFPRHACHRASSMPVYPYHRSETLPISSVHLTTLEVEYCYSLSTPSQHVKF